MKKVLLLFCFVILFGIFDSRSVKAYDATPSCSVNIGSCGLGNYRGMTIQGNNCFTICHRQFMCTIPELAISYPMSGGADCYNPQAKLPIDFHVLLVEPFLVQYVLFHRECVVQLMGQ
ncbi:MAG: hypothetical protein WCI36_01665 [bacterium]